LVVGSGRKERELKDWVKMENLTTQIIFLGTILDVESLFKILDISVLPSIIEGVAFSILEAQANGVPVVATSVGGITEIVKDKETGILVEPSNVDDLYRGIKLLLEDVSLREEIVNNAKREIKERFSLERMISKVMQVYGEAIRQRSAG
jgi:glycosyltransferase involved in cell wall biosynthesis